jgi:sterol desaturase/sphingolipid hydroxylase (fatty acid hydroxylase superfamily)
MKSAHMRHHYRDNHSEFGVTTDAWDKIFGTTENKKQKTLK